jgi:hypothetical protein
MSREVKSVSFRLTDPLELMLYEEAQKLPNFSGHMKNLFLLSIANKLPQQPVYNQTTKPSINLSSKPQIKQEYLNNLI